MRMSDLWDVKDPGPPKVRKSLRGVGINATWPELLAAEPKLQRFMDEILSVEGTTYESCSTATWYGWHAGVPRRGIKARLARFIGDDSLPFHAAYRALYGSLKTCRHCLERDPREADIEANIARRLRADLALDGPHTLSTQAGIADIVTPDSVYEVKLELSRVSMFQAIGQVSVYARELERPRRVIVGQWTRETERLAVHVRKLGIVVEVW